MVAEVTDMTDKKTFGSFIRQKRTEKNLSQKDLADVLFVTVGAVSKWERGVSYPDITLISELCRILEISEHELITASTDTDGRKQKQEARKFRMIRGAWIWIPTIAYGCALLICFICNLAVNHTLSWFFVVLASLFCGYTFVPTVTCFLESKKLLAFAVSTYCSIGLLLFTCGVYIQDVSWVLTACLGVSIGYVCLFLPMVLFKTKVSRYKFLIAFSLAQVLTILLLISVNVWHPFMLGPAVLITCYAFAPVLICALICTLRFNGFLKAGICILFSGVIGLFTPPMVDLLFGLNESSYQQNFNYWAGWGLCVLINGIVFIARGIFIIHKNRKRNNKKVV